MEDQLEEIQMMETDSILMSVVKTQKSVMSKAMKVASKTGTSPREMNKRILKSSRMNSVRMRKMKERQEALKASMPIMNFEF